LLIAAVLILVSERGQPAQIAPAGAINGFGGFGFASGDREPIAPPDSRPAAVPTLMATAGPAFTAAAPGQRSYIPVLMYHYIRYVDAGADPVGYGLSVTPEQFSAQLDWLRAAGYEAVRMDAVAACMRGEGLCPARAVALTFDDGYMDAYTAALPILQQHGYLATFYLVSGFVGQPGYMGWDEARALHAAGMEIGAHSLTHPDLTTLGLEDMRAQVAQSGALIAAEIGAPVVSFCYPAGRFNDTVVAVTGESGYTSATTTIADGPQDNPLTLPRLRMSGDLTLEGFQWMVQAYLP
jgi:peptidoglycan/xylan/chitin deacetylase (PgdA/CDA1 family)